MMQFRDLAAQYAALKDGIDEGIARVLACGCYIGGPEVAELEMRLAEYVGVKNCITCGNGTDALQLALMAWEVGSGDAVFVPDFTFFASAEAPALLGATPIFVDVDEHTFNLDPEKLKEAVRFVQDHTSLVPKAVIAVDLFGLPANYPSIAPFCKKNGLLLLEDGAQGFGGSINGKKVCSFGDISTTSFFPAKPFGCYGDGGAVFTDNDDWADLIRSYAVHGKGLMKYDNVRVGINSRLDTIQAAILLIKLEAFIGYELDAVNEVAKYYSTSLAKSDLVLPVIPEGYRSAWAQFTVRVPKGVDRGAVQARLKEANIPTMVYYPKTMSEQKAFGEACLRLTESSVAELICKDVLSLPLGPYLSREDILVIAESLQRLL